MKRESLYAGPCGAGSTSGQSANQKRRAYVRPNTDIVRVESTCHLMDTSMPGQHKPAQPGSGPTPVNPAKRGWFEEEEELTADPFQDWGAQSTWDD